jgi:prepilin-type N-terminal cleavage/methylation domain-containing protein
MGRGPAHIYRLGEREYEDSGDEDFHGVRRREQAVLKRWRELHRDEQSGFTLIELIIATSILLLVMGMFFSTLVSLTRQEDRAQRLVSNEQNVRFELDQLARELRAANPLVILPAKDDYSNQVAFVLGPTGGSQTVVRWTYHTDPALPNYERLEREQLSGTSSSATVLNRSWFLERVRNVEFGKPVFTFLDSHGVDMVADTNYDANGIATCAIRVHMEVSSDSNPGPLPFTETQDVELRNRLPGGWGC